jgi:hypothetical protein
MLVKQRSRSTHTLALEMVKRCFRFGHIEKGCNATQAELEQDLPPPPNSSKISKKAKVIFSFLVYICINMFLGLPNLSLRKNKS